MVIPDAVLYDCVMTQDITPQFTAAISALTYSKTQRVWSIIVSMFGDLARVRGDQIGGPAMSRIIAPIGIKPEAIRVALHRLRGDGWLESTKQGRTSVYQLATSGLAQSQQASLRIYARSQPAPDGWHLYVHPPKPAQDRSTTEKIYRRHGYIPVGSGVFLGSASIAPAPADTLEIFGDLKNIPPWLRMELGPPSLMQAYVDLNAALDQVISITSDAPTFTDFQIATLRTLIVHNWRRVLLNHVDLPDQFFPDGWRGSECQGKVMLLLDRLQRPEITALCVD
jgi:phenylacetic acid degradation operon negative regulatory protein